MIEISEVALETAEYIDYLDVEFDENGHRHELGLRRVWKPGSVGFDRQRIRAEVTAEVRAIEAEMVVLTTEATRLRDPAVTFTTMQLRNDLARLADDVARLGRDVIRLGRLTLDDFTA